MELEVFEPLMFLARAAAAPLRFARAIAGRLPANIALPGRRARREA
jgi:hypothetical protein